MIWSTYLSRMCITSYLAPALESNCCLGGEFTTLLSKGELLNSPHNSSCIPSSDIGKANFHHDGAGFMAITLRKDNLTAVFYDQQATLLYSTTVIRR